MPRAGTRGGASPRTAANRPARRACANIGSSAGATQATQASPQLLARKASSTCAGTRPLVMAHRTVRQLRLRMDAVFLDQLVRVVLRGPTPFHAEHLRPRAHVVFRMPVAAQAPLHVQAGVL